MAPAASKVKEMSNLERKFKLKRCIYKIRPFVKELKENGKDCTCLIANSHCVDPCFNAVTDVECDINCKPGCSNQLIRRQKYVQDLELFKTEKMGYGVRSKAFIPKNTYVIEFTGECLTLIDYKARVETPEYRACGHSYAVRITAISEMKKLPPIIIDAFRKGNISRFINSACFGSCEMRQISVDGVQRMTLWSTDDIPPNTELFYDYKFNYFDNEKRFVCLCGHVKCVTSRETLEDSTTFEQELLHPAIECILCKKKFDHMSILRRHQREVHHVTWFATDEELANQRCHCGLILRYKSEMKRHTESHENTRSHICPRCKKGFNAKRNLQQHLLSKNPCVP